MTPRPLIVDLSSIGLIASLIVWRTGSRQGTAPEPTADSPLQLRAALQMTGLFQVVLFVILAVQSRWSSDALMATSAVVGLTDLDALTMSLARSSTTAAVLLPVAEAPVAGVLSNTLLKLATALVLGGGTFRVATAVALGAMAVALATMLML